MINNKWKVIGGATLSLIPTIIYDLVKSQPFLSTVWSIIKFILNKIIFLLNCNVKTWWVLLFLLVVISALYIINRLNNEEIIHPDFCSYRNDKFQYTWSWEWIFDKKTKKWKICNLKAHCPKCDTPMIDYTNLIDPSFNCPRCNYISSRGTYEYSGKITLVIIDNIKKTNYTKTNQ